MAKTTEKTDPETCSKCGEIGQQNRMHFYFRTPERFICKDCYEGVQDSKRAERKDENRVNSNVN